VPMSIQKAGAEQVMRWAQFGLRENLASI
jgi:hypothetical protein